MTKKKNGATPEPDYNPYGDPANPLYGKCPAQPPGLPVERDRAPRTLRTPEVGAVLVEHLVSIDEATVSARLDIRVQHTGLVDIATGAGSLRVLIEVWRDGELARRPFILSGWRDAYEQIPGNILAEGDRVLVRLDAPIRDGICGATITPILRNAPIEVEPIEPEKELDPHALAARASRR